MSPHDIRFKTSFNCLISGMSGSGKTTWVKNLLTLREKLFTEIPAKVFLFYRAVQDMYLEMEQMGLVNELINVNEKSFISICHKVDYLKFYVLLLPLGL